jgi:hypothetical protein
MPKFAANVMFLSRAARLVGALIVLLWLASSAVAVFTDPNFQGRKPAEIFEMLQPSVVLYLVPGVALIICGLMVRAGRLWPAPVIFLISILSLFKLVLLLVHLPGPLFNAPLYWEIPVRVLSAALSVPCAFAWEDLAEMDRTRARRSQRGRPSDIVSGNSIAPPAPPNRTPPRTVRTQRQPIRPDDPPGAQTPWS